MWALVLVITTLVELGGHKLTVPLTDKDGTPLTFVTKDLCEQEQARITEEMVKAYPSDTDYYLECKLVIVK